jgi:hypothetical protein
MVIAQERQSARKKFKTADEEMQRPLEAKLAAVEERLKAVPGKLPVAKIWRVESVTYEARKRTPPRFPAAQTGSALRTPVAMATMEERRMSAANTTHVKRISSKADGTLSSSLGGCPRSDPPP